jgi:hypothetical protein
LDPHPPPKLLPPQKRRRRMIQRQLSLPHPFPHPLFILPHPPQQARRRMIQRQEDIPFPFSQPHPQLVAVKSSELIIVYSFILCRQMKSVP